MKKTVVIGAILAMSTAFAIGSDVEPGSAPATVVTSSDSKADANTSHTSDEFDLTEASAAKTEASD